MNPLPRWRIELIILKSYLYGLRLRWLVFWHKERS